MPNPEFRRTLIVGLGGSGQLILVHLKRMFMDTFGALPPSIKLLALDTDSAPASITSGLSDKQFTLAPQEFMHLKVENPQDFIKNMVGDWFVKPVPVGAITNGAGAIRQNGRLALFAHLDDLQRKFDTLIADLNNINLNRSMQGSGFSLSDRAEEIYVCGSLAGGTGSGTFLDVGILLRDQMPNAVIHGFFLLNWIYRNKAFAHRVGGNVYAALSELDDLQSISYGAPGFVPYEVKYGDRTIEVKSPPYTLFHLIDGRNEIGQNINDVQRLCDVVANGIFLSTGVMGKPVASAVDNLLAQINVSNPRVWGGRYARYSSLGVSSLYYPARELHRYEAAQGALKLCQMALGVSEKVAPPDPKAVEGSVGTFLNACGMSRTTVRNLVCPSRPEITFEAEKFEIADREFPSLLKAKWQEERDAIGTRLERIYNERGSVNVEQKRRAFQDQLAILRGDAKLSTSYQRDWVDVTAAEIRKWDAEAAKESAAAAEEIESQRKGAEDALEVATKALYLPFIGGPRTGAAERFAEAVETHLRALERKMLLDFERRCYETLLKELGGARPAVVPAGSQVAKALTEAAGRLRGMVDREEKTLQTLADDPTRVLIGGGKSIIVDDRARKLQDPALLPEAYADFTRVAKISRPEDYLEIYNNSLDQLVGTFYQYAYDEEQDISKVGVQKAMAAIAAKELDPAAYYSRQFDDLFRLSSAMWSFNRGYLNEIQSPQYQRIINIGFPEAEEGYRLYKQPVDDIKAKHKIEVDVSYSTTGDPYGIWLLRFAAALPLYFVNGLEESRDRYLEEITPTYHIDKYFEMNVPDLFPVSDRDNLALRVLGLAIVPPIDETRPLTGIAVIKDEKLGPKEGHVFTCDAPAAKKLNNENEPEWRLFRKMYSDVKDTYDPKSRPEDLTNLLNVFRKLLHDRLDPILNNPEKAPEKNLELKELMAGMTSYLAKVRSKLAERDFSRLISAKLTYREVKGLEEFLDNMNRPGYNLDVYFSGKGAKKNATSRFSRMGG